MSALSRRSFQLHRWLSWAIGLQLLVWVASGIVFAWLPFQPWVKGGDMLQRPLLAPSRLPPELATLAPDAVRSLTAVATPRGAAWRVGLADGGRRYVPLDGSPWVAPDAAGVARFARTLVRGDAPLLAAERLDKVPKRLGIVDEVGGAGPLWRVRFDDALATRIYLDGEGGDLVAIRNEAWVGYDFLWRLHIMDYGGGEDFNNALLRGVASAAAIMVGAGVVLSVLALRRAWRRRRAPPAP